MNIFRPFASGAMSEDAGTKSWLTAEGEVSRFGRRRTRRRAVLW
jgi:hypothetical protein